MTVQISEKTGEKLEENNMMEFMASLLICMRHCWDLSCFDKPWQPTVTFSPPLQTCLRISFSSFSYSSLSLSCQKGVLKDRITIFCLKSIVRCPYWHWNSCCNLSSRSYWPLRARFLMCFKWKWWQTKFTVLFLCKNILQSLAEANLRLQQSDLL